MSEVYSSYIGAHLRDVRLRERQISLIDEVLDDWGRDRADEVESSLVGLHKIR